MVIFQAVANNKKQEIAELLINKMYSEKYMIDTCNTNQFATYNSLKLELLFLDNLEYFKLSAGQTKKILAGNYKNLFVKLDDLEKIEKLQLHSIIEVTNIYNNGNDLWEEFES